MKIKIEANGHRFIIPLPLRLALNGITIRIIASCIEKYTDIPLKEEYLIIGAHLDHVGSQAGLLFPGANDNASGSAGALE